MPDNATPVAVAIPANGSARVVDLTDDTLPCIYEHVGCDTVTVVTTQLDGVTLDIWVDDNGLIRTPSPAVNRHAARLAGQVLVGNVLITAHDRHGHTVGLDQAALDAVAARLDLTDLARS